MDRQRDGSTASGGSRDLLFHGRDQLAGHEVGAATLTLDRRRRPTIAPRRHWHPAVRSARNLFAELDLVVDLGSGLGSRDWWRGVATLAALCWTMIHFAPSLATLPARADPPMDEAAWQEERALALAPLAYGGDTGRRMAATDAVEPLVGAPERPQIDTTATLGIGDGFAHELVLNGVGAAEARAVAAMVARQVPLEGIRPGTRIDLTLGSRPRPGADRPLDFLRLRAGFDLKLALTRVDGGLRLDREPIAVDNTPLRITGVVGESLYRAARESGVPGAAIAAYLKAVASRISLDRDRDLGPGDRFDMIIRQRRAATGEVETGELLYAGLQRSGGADLQLLRWNNGQDDDWYSTDGRGERRGQMRIPVDNGRETSAFGMRFHPILGYSRMHAGVDFGAAFGSPIYAAIDGTVTFAGWHGGHGNFVQVFASKAFGTGYGHMSRIAVTPGQHVAQGQIIGYVGSTGLSTGPHLHYEVYENGVPVDPMSVSYDQFAQLSGDALARFRATLARLLTVRPGARALPAVQSAAAARPASPRG